MALMGIDVGTTGVKCSILDYEGNPCSFEYMEYRVVNPESGYYELNPIEVWSAVKNVIGKAMEKHQYGKIEAICVSSLGEAAVPMDRNNRPLYNSLLYTDSRGKDQVEALVKKVSREGIMNITGLPAHSMYTLAKVMWFRDKRPDIYKETSSFMLFGDYITYMLSGKAVIDYSLASRTMAFNIIDKKWDSKMLDAAGIDRYLFSTLAPTGTPVGYIRQKLADEFGMNKDALIVTGCHDQVSAAIGSGIMEKNIAANGMGTAECITPFLEKAITGPKMLESNFACVPYIWEGTYITYAFNFSGGSLLKWYRDHFAYQQVMLSNKTGESPYAILDREAFSKPTDLFVLPHFAGTGTPYMDTGAKGAIIGLTFDVTAGILYKALMEGVVYEMLYNIECLEKTGIPIKVLRAVGGGAKSDLWLQLKADIMGKKIEKLNIDEAGNLGNIIIAGVASGIYKTYKNAVDKLVRVKSEYYPDSSNNEIYRQKFSRYKKIYSSMKELSR